MPSTCSLGTNGAFEAAASVCMLWFRTNNLEGRRGKGSYVQLTNSMIASAAFTQNLLWSVHYGPDHFSTTHTHRNTHMHDLSHFLGRKLRLHMGRKSHDSALLPFEVRRVLFRCLWRCVCTRASQHTLRTEQADLLKKERERIMNATKQFCLAWTLITLTLLLSSISSVWEFCLTAHPTFSQPLKDPRVHFRRTTWRLPFTARESSSSPAWWALWWCAG